MSVSQPRRATPFREFFAGVGFLFRGFRIWITAPRLMFLGMIPAAIVGALSVALLIALIANIDWLAIFFTPFANDWSEVPRVAIRFAGGLALLLASVLVIINAYTTATLMVGDIFYRKIADHVESLHGAPSAPDAGGFWRDARRGFAEGIRLVFPTIGLALLVFVLGFLPVVGTVTAATIATLLGGWLLVTELANIPFESRGLHLTARRRVLKSARPRSLGFGAATYLVFLIPFGAVIAMPAALAGATLLTRSLLDEGPGAPSSHPGPQQPPSS